MRAKDTYSQLQVGVPIQRPILPDDFPLVVCLCGSTRFKKEFEEAQVRLTNEGVIVLSVGRFGHLDGLKMEEEVCRKCGKVVEFVEGGAALTLCCHARIVTAKSPLKKKLDQLHFRKIDLADGIFVIDGRMMVCKDCGHKTPHPTGGPCPCMCNSLDTFVINGYIGESTRNEIEYALSLGKTVSYLSKGN